MLKSWVKRVAVQSGMTRAAGSVAAKGVAILMYHGVTDDPEEHKAILGGIDHPTSVFEKQMEVLAREYHPISLDEAFQFANDGKDVPRRSVVVTFDDGYADNYHVAMPILSKVGVPATFYITVDCVDQKKLPWPARLRYALFTTRNSAWTDPEGTVWPLGDPQLRAKAFDRACECCCKLSGAEQDQFVAAHECQLKAALSQGPLMMTWEEVRGTVKRGHIIGSHTLSHPNMAHINGEALRREMSDSKKILERELGTEVSHFSYPCPALQPHWNDRTVSVSRESGYKSAVTTNSGLTRRGDNPLRLKRISANKKLDGLRADLELAFLGLRV